MPTRRERIQGPAITIGVLSAATVALRFRDPHQSGSWGLCPLYAVTGIYCPGCGGLRAVNDLTHGHVGDALSSNLLVTIAIPFGVLALGVAFLAAWRGVPPPRMSPRWSRALWSLAAVTALAFTVIRNTPWGNWLAPV